MLFEHFKENKPCCCTERLALVGGCLLGLFGGGLLSCQLCPGCDLKCWTRIDFLRVRYHRELLN